MQTLQGFKNTDAGLIPEDWNALQVRDVCRLINGRGFKPYEWSDRGLPIIRIQNLNGSDNFNYFQGRFDQKILIQNGQLLFAWSGSRGTSFGPHLWTGNDAVLNYHTWKIVPNEKITKDYLYFALRGITSFIEDNAHGASALVHTQKWEMEGFYLAVPPADEQAAIAIALQDADEVVSCLERLIVKKQAVKQGMMQQLLTENTRLPGFADDWKVCKLTDLLSYEQPTKYLVKSTRQLEIGTYPVLTAGKTFLLGYTNETHGVYRSHPVIIFDDFTTASQIVDFDFKAKSSAMKILSSKPSISNIRFVYELMQILDFQLGDHKRYWISEYGQQDVRVPSIEEQQAIARIAEDAESEIAVLRRRLDRARLIKQGMMQELLTGRTRLKPAEAGV